MTDKFIVVPTDPEIAPKYNLTAQQAADAISVDVSDMENSIEEYGRCDTEDGAAIPQIGE